MSFSTFVINLKSRPDRLLKFLNQKNPVPSLEIFEAIKNIKHPNIGCAQSHKSVLEISKNRNDKYCFIFEDDAVLKLPFTKLANDVENLDIQTPDWEILLFSSSHAIDSDDYLILESGQELICLQEEFCGTYAMAISSKAYDKIIKAIDGMSSRQDIDINVYSVVCATHIYLCVPFMCYVLKNDQSDIRKCDTTDDFERLKNEEIRLILKTSLMFSLFDKTF